MWKRLEATFNPTLHFTKNCRNGGSLLKVPNYSVVWRVEPRSPDEMPHVPLLLCCAVPGSSNGLCQGSLLAAWGAALVWEQLLTTPCGCQRTDRKPCLVE